MVFLDPCILQGLAKLKELVLRATDRVKIMAGAGIRLSNVRSIVSATGVLEIHGTCRHSIQSCMTFRREGIYMGSVRRNEEGVEFRWKQSDCRIVEHMLQVCCTPNLFEI
jgi:copper homeostasis protein CutC